MEWLARNKRAPPHTTRVREYPSIRYTYTVRYRVYPPLVSRDSRDSEPIPLVTQRIYRTPYATGAAWCERGRETYQPVRMRRRQFQPARSTNGKARQRRSAGRSTCSQSERLNNVVWFGHDNTSTSVVMFSFFRILESAKDVAPSSPAKTQPRSNSAVPHPPRPPGPPTPAQLPRADTSATLVCYKLATDKIATYLSGAPPPGSPPFSMGAPCAPWQRDLSRLPTLPTHDHRLCRTFPIRHCRRAYRKGSSAPCPRIGWTRHCGITVDGLRLRRRQ